MTSLNDFGNVTLVDWGYIIRTGSATLNIGCGNIRLTDNAICIDNASARINMRTLDRSRSTVNFVPCAGNTVTIRVATRSSHTTGTFIPTTSGGGHGWSIVDPMAADTARRSAASRIISTSWGWVLVDADRRDTGMGMTTNGVYAPVCDIRNSAGWDNVRVPVLGRRGTNRVSDPSIDALLRVANS
jgi:hypothetical protein